MLKSNFDRDKVNQLAINYLESQKKEGQIANFFELIQPNLDRMNLDSNSKKELIGILFQMISLNAQMTTQLIADFFDDIYTQKNQNP